MSYRTYRHARRGEVFATPWIEWHVQCAAEDCDAQAMVAEMGEAGTLREAEAKTRRRPELAEWRKLGGPWYCPLHRGDRS